MPVWIGGQKYDGVKINGICYPVTNTSVTTQVLFRVQGSQGQKFFGSPEIYYDTVNRRPRGEDGESQRAMEWQTKRQAFLDGQQAWYDRLENIKRDVAGWIERTRSKIDPRGYTLQGEMYTV